MQVAPGFRVELVAHEPMIKDPVFVDWDDQGRMWVGELRTYMMDLDGGGEGELPFPTSVQIHHIGA